MVINEMETTTILDVLDTLLTLVIDCKVDYDELHQLVIEDAHDAYITAKQILEPWQ